MPMSPEKVLAALRASMKENERLRARIAESQAAAREPIAIVGMACRYPGGVESPEELWDLVASGAVATGGFPDDRGWDLEALHAPGPGTGRSHTREGGFLYGAGEFDAEFFGISPREALAMDPQQRLLLEVAWEALERSGIDPSSLRATPTGVWIGATDQGYGPQPEHADEETAGYVLSGNAAAVLSGRVAYSLGLEGPAVTVDTACSSSLVALHQACQALRQGECTTALAGGVAVLARPGAFVEFSHQGGLAPDGRCKSFADAADGTAWGEGVGVVVLERLSVARARGRRVLAVVRGSAVNQDGASNGLTAPSGPSQQRVVRRALAAAGVGVGDVDVVEAHGTGTRLGDPIEAQALLEVFGPGRDRDRPVWLGSLKSNIGHTQAAAGVGGVIKMVLALRHGVVPRTLHAGVASSAVDWSSGAVRLATESVPWPVGDRPRRAGVSAFGVGGTNAHIIIEDAPPAEDEDEDGDGGADAAPAPDSASGGAPLTWVLSARSEAALSAQAARLADRLDGDSAAHPADVAHALVADRAALEERAVLVGRNRCELLDATGALARGEAHAGLLRGCVPPAGPGPTAFLFAGQGSQRPGMGRELYEAYPAFATAFDEVCAELDRHLDRPLAETVADPTGLLDRTEYTQAALFALEVALYQLVRSWGVRPDHLVGHSIGELAAAHVAGVLDLPDAAALVAARGRLMGRLPEGGAMIAVRAAEDDVRPLLAAEENGERVSIAAVNGPDSVVLSGDGNAVERIAARLAADGCRTRRLRVSHAFHSSRMDGMLAGFRAVAASLTYREPTVPVVSNVTGRHARPGELSTPEYWVRHVREAVRFHDGMHALEEAGVTGYLEIGPDGTLSSLGRSCLRAPGAVLVPGLRRNRPEPLALLEAVGRLWAHGASVDWAAAQPRPATGAHPVDLPTYPFQRRRYWWTRPATARPVEGGSATSAFWDAVEREDAAELSGVLGTDPEALEAVLPGIAAWRRHTAGQAAAGSWGYRVRWKRRSGQPAGTPSGTWLVLAPADPGPRSGTWPRAVAEALATGGAETVTRDVSRVDLTRAGLAALVRDVGQPGGRPDGIVSLLALGGDRPAAATLALVQALSEAEVDAPVWTLTHSAVRAAPTDGPPCPDQAQVWGLGRVAALEHPERWGGLIDLPESPHGDGCVRHLLAALAGAVGEDQVAVRPSGLHVRRLAPAPEAPAHAWHPRGTVLVTGGTGALGAHTARRLAEAGAEHLVLASRRGVDAPGAGALRSELAASGTRVTLAACDVGDRAALAALLAEYPPDAVVHAAGAALVKRLSETGPDDLAATLAAKVDGARHLDELLADRPLDAFVLFSSVAGVWGVGGQGAYAAANAALDALAERRRERGAPATAIAWGPWAGGGMAEDAGIGAELDRRGLRPLDPGLAGAAVTTLVGTGSTDPVVADVDWSVFLPAFTSLRSSPLLADLADLAEAATADTPAEGGSGATPLRDRLLALPTADRPAELLGVVRTRAAAVLGLDGPGAVDADRAFRDLGFDSLTAVELRQRLGEETGLDLPTTLVFDHPDARTLTGHLLSRLASGTGPDHAPAPGAPVSVAADEPIVIVGMACRFPGGVESPEELWRLLADGVDAVGAFPDDRGWNVDELHDPERRRRGTSSTRHGGFLYGAGEFDAEFFGISPREALAMDPQQRLLLEVSWEALERSGIDPSSLRATPTGVWIGAAQQGYGPRSAQDADEVEGYVLTGTASSVASGRISYTLGLEGPAVTVDTACSSSLVALHQACQALRQGECTTALVGGATVIPTPEPFIEFSRQGGLAADGRCKAYADAADGTAWGEGVGVLVVERLSHAQAGGHPVLAVVQGSAINQDGASNGLTAPSGPAQQRVVRRALAVAGVAASDVDAVEGHGTGTRLGDPIEARALLEVFGPGRDPERPLLLGSLKSNIGHTAAVGGIAGVMKMVLALRHGTLPRTLHVDRPSEEVDWSSGAVRLLTEPVEWRPGDRIRRAGVSSFGISGTNAHVVLEEPPTAEPDRAAGVAQASPAPTAWVLSAKSGAALRGQAAGLRDHLDRHGCAGLVPTARALVAGRASFAHRGVVVGSGPAEMRAGLAALAADEARPNVARGVRIDRPQRLAVLFTGQGSQRPGMGRGLYEVYPAFAASFDEACAELDRHLDHPLRDIVFSEPGTPEAKLLDRTYFTQPALFALETALYRLIESRGVEVDLLAGHSVGEVAAAHVAGVLDLRDACALVAARGRLMEALPEGGAMAAVRASEDEVLPVLARIGGQLEISAFNGPRSVVLSGASDAVRAAAETLRGQRIRTRDLTVSHAFHSSLMDPILEELRRTAEQLHHHPADIPLVSAVTGGIATDGVLASAAYWADQARQPVRFADAVRSLEREGATLFLELGPDAVLTPMAQEILGEPVGAVAAQQRSRPEAEALLTALGRLHVLGAPAEWAVPQGRDGATPVDLPTYAFQRRTYWLRSVGLAGTDGRLGEEAAERPEDAPEARGGEDGPEGPDALGTLSGDALRTRVDALVRAETATALGHDDGERLDMHMEFPDLGFTSLAAVELRNRLAELTGLDLPPTLVYDYLTPAELADGVVDLLAG